MAQSKICEACWQGGPPVYWERKTPIPSKKADLLNALKSKNMNGEAPLESLNKDELRYVYRAEVQGFRSTSDPTTGMSSMTKDELMKKLSMHGISMASQSPHRGALMTALRDHWFQQCKLANDLKENGEENGDQTWELMSTPRGMTSEYQAARKAVRDSLQNMMETTTFLFDVMSRDPTMQKSIEEAVEAHHAFALSLGALTTE